jgi:hypothetical protein
MASMNLGETSAAMRCGDPPALLIKTSRRPKRLTAVSMTSWACSGWRTSAATKTAPATSASVRPHVTTLAPDETNAATMPAPTPREPPVTTTT